MRLLKRWRYLLIALVLIGTGGMAAAYLRSPGYRAAQAKSLVNLETRLVPVPIFSQTLS
mgnify:CR=1 FL=1